MNVKEIELYCNVLVAATCFVLTIGLLYFVSTNRKAFLASEKKKRSSKSKAVGYAAAAILFSVTAFIVLCGASHLAHAFCVLQPDSTAAEYASGVVLILYTISSGVTLIASVALFPFVTNALTSVKLDSDGKLQLAESYMVEIVNMLKESVVVLSPDAKIIRGNDISKIIFGNNFLGETLTDLVYREDKALFEATLLQVLHSRDSAPVSIEYRVNKTGTSVSSPSVMESGASVWVESTFCRGTNVNSQGELEYDVKMITRNIDDRKRGVRYRQYYKAAKERDLVNEAKLRYISCVTHDLKTPLQSFCFTTELLKQTELSAEQSELLEQANVAVDLMKLTISQTMDISKALTGAKLVPRRIPVLLSSIIDRVRIIIHGYGKQVPVSFTVAPMINDAIITDEEWLWQMLLNLLTNACKYTDRGSIEVRVSLTSEESGRTEKSAPSTGMRALLSRTPSKVADIYIPSDKSNLLFEVIDTGVGIREDKLDSMFDAFSQVQSGQVTGTGLGLFGLRRRVEGLNGTCGARHNTESPTGTGTVVWFSFPYMPDNIEEALTSSDISMSASTPSVRIKSVPATPVAQMSSPMMIRNLIQNLKLSAVIVDDTATIRKLMEKFLLQLGFDRVYPYENGAKGLEGIMKQQVDFVFSDIQMPIMTGPEMVRRFRLFEAGALRTGTRTKRQLIVAVSANQPDAPQSPGEGEGEGESSGDFDFVCAKPLSREDLTRLLLHYVSANGDKTLPTTDRA